MTTPLRARLASHSQVGAAKPLLLLIGTHGTGKRPIANYLRVEHGFHHLDFTDGETRERFLGSSDGELSETIAAVRAADRGLVITWSAGPGVDLDQVFRLRSLGIEPVWFDSDRGTACRACFADVPCDPCMRFVDTFEADGRFRPVDAIAGELCSQPGADLASARRDDRP